ncbi:MAG: DUF1573 domain-containing protein [Akkermansiaceae bacterium]|nr:DUF1573 domain-containing protein [Verrucomicrobiales bacterium]
MNQRWTFLSVLALASGLSFSSPAAGNDILPIVPVAIAPAVPLPNLAGANPVDAILKWSAETREVTVTNGTVLTHFNFQLTNVSSEPIVINSVQASCGCTTAQLPAQPWTLVSGTNGEINVTMNLAGKMGLVTKTVTINTDKGSKILFVKSNILPPTAAQMASGDREVNQKLALADRQAVLRGDCAKCHSETKDASGHDKLDKELYASVCGVCHESEHRAAMVPNLRTLAQETNAEYWRNWITHGKPGTLMPAFSDKEGGILNEAQIESLVKYLTATIPARSQANIARPLPLPQPR